MEGDLQGRRGCAGCTPSSDHRMRWVAKLLLGSAVLLIIYIRFGASDYDDPQIVLNRSTPQESMIATTIPTTVTTANAPSPRGVGTKAPVTAIATSESPRIENATIMEDPICKVLFGYGKRDQPPVQYVHIPKAGGTSVQAALVSWAINQKIPYVFQDNGKIHWTLPPSRGTLKDYGLAIGHRGVGFSQGFDPNALVILTLRNPIDRTVSNFEYMKATKTFTPPMVKRVIDSWKNYTIDQIVEDYHQAYRTQPATCLQPNGTCPLALRAFHRSMRIQLFMVCGYDCQWPFIGSPEAATDPIIPESELLERALTNVEAAGAVSVLERLDELIPQLRLRISWMRKGFSSFQLKYSLKDVLDGEKKPEPPTERTLKLLRESVPDEEFKLYERADARARKLTEKALSCIKARGITH